MSISGISTSATDPSQTLFQTAFKQRAQDFRALQSALQSGDLSGAQKAFATFQQDLQSTPSAAQKAQNNPGNKDFQALQSALQASDLSGAQQAFANLQQNIQSSHKAHHHHHKQASSNGANSGVSSASGATASPGASFLLDQKA